MARQRLAYQMPILQTQKEVIVTSHDELKQAIGNLVIETRNFPGLSKGYFPGKIIRIGKVFTILSTIEIPQEAIGLVIDGTRTSLIPDENGMTAFDCKASGVIFKNLFLGGAEQLATAFFGTLVKFSGGCDNCMVLDNHLSGARLVDGRTASSLAKLIIRGNTMENTTDPTWVDVVEMTDGIISGNQFEAGSGTNVAVILGAGCGGVAVTGNAFDACDITTTASDGLNTVVGNTDVGTATLHASDVSGNNS